MKLRQTFVAPLVLSLLSLASGSAQAAVYKLDGSHTDVAFKVKHLMLTNVKGRFNKSEGGFEYDEKTKTVSKVAIKIDASSVDTNDKKRDEHLQSPDFFDTKKFATIEFTADKVTGVESGKAFKIPGKLKIHGVEKAVTLDAEFRGTTTDPWGNEKIVFAATTKVNRSNYGLNWNKTLDKGGVVVGEEVTIEVEAEANKAK
jgi:polyisoprenoid-binding protein YceI